MWLSRMETQNLCFNEIKTLNLRGVLCFCMIKLGKCTMSHCRWQWKWRYSQRILSRVRNGTGFSIILISRLLLICRNRGSRFMHCPAPLHKPFRSILVQFWSISDTFANFHHAKSTIQSPVKVVNYLYVNEIGTRFDIFKILFNE